MVNKYSHREDQSKDHFDLLPFINILMCSLACLLLVTLSITALSIGPAAGEGWVPVFSGKSKIKIPVLIEWDGKSMIIHYENGNTEVSATNTEKIKEVIEYFHKKNITHYALFAVRPSGFSSFELLANLFRKFDIKVGYEPIKQGRTVKLIPGKKI